jgi:hypothetical protein
MISPDLGLESDSILGFLGVGLFAYGLGGGDLRIAATGAVIAGWFGGLALARVGGLDATIANFTSSVTGSATTAPATTSTNGAGTGTP